MLRTHLVLAAVTTASCTPKDKDIDGVETDTIDTVIDSADTGEDTVGETDESDTHTGETSETSVPLPGPADLSLGELVITEIMVDPTECTDPRGEYVELVYQGVGQVDLGGLVLTNPVGTSAILSGPYVVNPGDRFVLYANPRSSSPCYNFGANATGYDPVLTFPNAGDVLTLQDHTGRALDTIDYGAFGAPPAGASWELHVSPDDQANDLPENWCVASDVIGGASADRGTPGLPNTCSPGSDTDTGAPSPDTLLITEVLDFGSPDTLRYVEIWNPGSTPVPLDDWRLALYEDGSSIPLSSTFPASASVPANGCYLVGPDNGLPAADFTAAFNSPAQAFLNAVQGNGNDAYALFFDGTTVDTFGQRGVDGIGTAWDYTGKVAWRDASVTVPRATWQASEWTVGDLSKRNPCVRERPVVETDTALNDTNFIFDSFETGVREDTIDTEIIDTAVDPLAIQDLMPGDLVITEIMAAPTHCSGSNGEYIEFFVDPRIGAPVDLNGLQIQNASGLSVGFGESRLVLPGSYVLAWFRPSGTDQCYGLVQGLGVDYTSLTLNDAGDLVRLKYDTTVFDEVDFSSGFSVTPGVSLQLDNRRNDTTLNNDPSNWCGARSSIVVGAFPIDDRGTPGADNGTCIGLGDVGDTDVPVLTPQDLIAGDLVITEVMGDPAAPCTDDNGEYLEIANKTPANVRLDGLKVAIGFATHTLTGTGIELAPDELAILYRSPTTTSCFAFSGVPSAPYANGLDIDDAGIRVAIEVGSNTIDAVDFSLFSPPFSEGSAWTLDEDKVDATQNNIQNAWCFNGTLLGSGNSGRPGSLASCPP